jgi:hypothetical protein
MVLSGASGRTRTDTLLRAADFESAASTNFATLAQCELVALYLDKIGLQLLSLFMPFI